jgi:alpha-N-arabinofuranosidase
MPFDAHIDVATEPLPAPIDPRIHGHFLESSFFGNIEGGLLDPDSPLSVAEDGPLQGCRRDVIDACRDLGVPLVRWPGGNVASATRWEDGTGPREERPRTLELAWGSEESHRFGTPEFLAWCEAIGAEPYLAHSCRSVDDAVRWVEYCNHDGDTTLARRRAADGLAEPHPVRIWGLGNEVYGPWQMGHREVADYAADAREHARFMRAVDPSLRFVAVGQEDPAWLDEVVRVLGEVTEWISVHAYGADFHLVDPSETEWDAVVAQSLHLEGVLQRTSEAIARAAHHHGVTSPLAIAFDEWNMRHYEPRSWEEPEPGEDGGIAPRDTSGPADPPAVAGEVGWRVNRCSPRTLADLLFYAGVFHAMHRTAQNTVPVTMANTVNLINANALLAVRGGGVVRSATFHVWETYRRHFGTRPLAATCTGPSRSAAVRHETGIGGEAQCIGVPAAVPLLDVSASTSEDGSTLYIAIINRDREHAIPARLTLDGLPLTGEVRLRTLGADAPDLWTANSLSDPEAIAPRLTRAALDGGGLEIPAHSLTVLSAPHPAPRPAPNPTLREATTR